MNLRHMTITCTLDRFGNQLVYLNGDRFQCPERGKTNALCYAFSALIKLQDWDVFILKDDDVSEPDPLGKCEFVKEFSHPNLGVLCGNRRFVRTKTIPEAARHVWGVFANMVMTALNIPCGAYMAIHRELIPEFMKYWERSVFDDTMAADICRRRGLNFAYDHRLTELPEKSSISWRELWNFSVRQYIDVRCHGPWIPLLSVWALFLIATVYAWSVPAFVLPIYACFWLFSPIQKNLKTLIALPIAQAIFIAAIPVAGFKRRFNWRGYDFEVTPYRI